MNACTDRMHTLRSGLHCTQHAACSPQHPCPLVLRQPADEQNCHVPPPRAWPMVAAVCRGRGGCRQHACRARLPLCLLKVRQGQVRYHARISSSTLSAQYQRASLAMNSLACLVAMLPWPHCTYQYRPGMPAAASSGCLTASNTLPRQSLCNRRVVPRQMTGFIPVDGLSDRPNASSMLSCQL